VKHRHWKDWGAALTRRAIQLAVVVFIVWASYGPIWRNFKSAHNNSRLVGLMSGEVSKRAYENYEATLKHWNEDTLAGSRDFVGFPWAANAFGAETVDPIMAIAHLTSTGEWTPAMWLGCIVPVLIAVVLGKVFCSFLCPMRLLFEIGQVIRAGLARLGLPVATLRVKQRFGGWVLVGGLAGTLLGGFAIWHLLLPYVAVGATTYLAINGAWVVAGVLLVIPLFWLSLDVFLAPGFFCHNVCPQGFLLEQLGRFSLLRLKKDTTTRCPSSCRACVIACPYGLSPRRETHHPACNSCGACIPACPDRKLSRRVSLPVLSGLLVFLIPLLAAAHHNKGLPHYGYYENYPQVPTQETIVVDGRWEMGATVFNFQGLQRRDATTPNDVKIFVYIYDLERDENYVGPVRFVIESDGVEVSDFVRDGVDAELIYQTREIMPHSGRYKLFAEFEVDGQKQRVALEFDIDLSVDSVNWLVVAGIVAPTLPLLALALVGRSRRGRTAGLRLASRASRAGGVYDEDEDEDDEDDEDDVPDGEDDAEFGVARRPGHTANGSAELPRAKAGASPALGEGELAR
jgi:ferredoxin-type protein NapH